MGAADTSPTGSADPSGEAPAAGLQPPPPIAAVVPSTRYTQIVLTGLREDVRAGLAYEIDLTFERAGRCGCSRWPTRRSRGSLQSTPSDSARPRARPAYRCADCGQQSAQWVGRCPSCQAWGTLDGRRRRRPAQVAAGAPSSPARPIAEVELDTARARPTGVAELDRVLGGGLVPGAVVLLAGEPGVGKSTLLLEVAAQAARTRHASLYVTGEESAAQVRLRAERTGAAARRPVPGRRVRPRRRSLGHLDAVAPQLLVVDSVQTMSTTPRDGAAGRRHPGPRGRPSR